MSASEKRRTVTLNPCYENPLLTQTNFGRSSRRFPNQRETFHNKNILNWRKSYIQRFNNSVKNLLVFLNYIARIVKEKSIPLKSFIWSKPKYSFPKTYSRFRFQEVRVNVVFNYLKKLSRKKACGHDRLPPCILMASAIIIANLLTHVINSLLQTGIVPEDFKHAIVTQSSNLDQSKTLTTIDRSASCQLALKSSKRLLITKYLIT